MKRSVTLFIVFSILSVAAFGDKFIEDGIYQAPADTMRSMTVGGRVGIDSAVRVDVIMSSPGSAEGTPFDLLGDDVLLSSGNVGRKIANWTIFTNSNKANLKVTAGSLKHVAGPSVVPYVLRFEYSLDGKSNYFYVLSEAATGKIGSEINNSLVAENGEWIITSSTSENILINSSDIRFFIPSGAIDDVKDNTTTPSGTYRAEVKVEILGD